MTLRGKLLPHTWGGRKQIPTASHFLVCLAMKTPLLRHDSSRIADFMRRVQNLSEDAIAARTEYFANFQKTDFHLLDNDRAIISPTLTLVCPRIILARFDGTALYEDPDPQRGEQPDWGTYVFN